MHTPAAADSDVAPIWADIDVHRGPGRQGRARGSAMGARPRPRAPTPHDAAGGMAPVLGALGAQIVMAEALGAPALNVGARGRSLGWRAQGPRPKRDSSPLAGRVPALASSRARRSAFGLNSQLPSPDTDPWLCAPGACGARDGHRRRRRCISPVAMALRQKPRPQSRSAWMAAGAALVGCNCRSRR